MTVRDLKHALGTIRYYAALVLVCFLLFVVASVRGCRFLGDDAHVTSGAAGSGGHARGSHGFYHK